jgi:acetyl-CoA carboxylase carboxyltransferase component
VIGAYAEASVPLIPVIVRKAYGGAYVALASHNLGYHAVITWPRAQIGVIGAEQAARIMFRHELATSRDHGRMEREKIEEIQNTIQDPFNAIRLGQIDMIIEPDQTRDVLIRFLDTVSARRKCRGYAGTAPGHCKNPDVV